MNKKPTQLVSIYSPEVNKLLTRLSTLRKERIAQIYDLPHSSKNPCMSRVSDRCIDAIDRERTRVLAHAIPVSYEVIP